MVAGAVDSSGASGSPQWCALVLPRCSEQSFDGRRENWLQWVLKKQPEVGEGVCYLLDESKGTGGLLVARWRCVDAWKGLRRPGEEDWDWVGFLAKSGLSVCGGGLSLRGR